CILMYLIDRPQPYNRYTHRPANIIEIVTAGIPPGKNYRGVYIHPAFPDFSLPDLIKLVPQVIPSVSLQGDIVFPQFGELAIPGGSWNKIGSGHSKYDENPHTCDGQIQKGFIYIFGQIDAIIHHIRGYDH